MSDHTPIDCNLYDRYEAWATLRTPLEIRYRDPAGTESVVKDRIVDLLNADGEERMVLSTGLQVRLDHIISVFVDVHG
jgi:Rho-binding antiterminator